MLSRIEFIEYLTDAWLETPKHNYAVPKKSKDNGNLDGGSLFEVSSLKECLTNYTWMGSNYSKTHSDLNTLETKIKTAMIEGDEDSTYDTIIEIYKWGNVQFNSTISGSWLSEQASKSKVIEKLQDCIDIIEDSKDFSRFDGKDLIMNSGFTKAVSLASRKDKPLIIFDGRVGAALGHLAIRAKRKHGYDSISPELIYPWGQSRSSLTPNPRNPSADNIRFPRLFGANSHSKHARAMQNGSSIVREVSANLGISPRDLEAALFMWGYDVRNS
jgi:hypothetical protein